MTEVIEINLSANVFDRVEEELLPWDRHTEMHDDERSHMIVHLSESDTNIKFIRLASSMAE